MRNQTLGLSLSLIVLAFGSLIAQSHAPDVIRPRPQILGRFIAPYVRFYLELAILNAERRLAEPECARVLNDFHDKSGRPLMTVLEGRGVSVSAFLLGWVRFVDGSDQSTCHSPRAPVAFTSPGSNVIYICATNGPVAETFSSTSHTAEAVVIHEMLHALGLGENPPTSNDITVIGHAIIPTRDH